MDINKMSERKLVKKRHIKIMITSGAVLLLAGVVIACIMNSQTQEKIPETAGADRWLTEEWKQTTLGDVQGVKSLITKKTVTIAARPATTSSAAETEKCSQYRLHDTVFFGDSRTLGLEDYDVVPEAEVIASRGISLSKVGEKPVIGEGDKKITMIEALKKVQCKRVFMMFGLNELGWPYESTFKEAYRKLINQVKEAQPEAKIYVQAIFPMTEGRTDEIYNNENIAKFNGYIKAVAKETGVTYIDASPAVVNANGTLPKEASDDGIHLNKKYCGKWMEFIVEMIKREESRE